jgi:hypothetical protein
MAVSGIYGVVGMLTFANLETLSPQKTQNISRL